MIVLAMIRELLRNLPQAPKSESGEKLNTYNLLVIFPG